MPISEKPTAAKGLADQRANSQEMLALERMAITRQTILRAARLEG